MVGQHDFYILSPRQKISKLWKNVDFPHEKSQKHVPLLFIYHILRICKQKRHMQPPIEFIFGFLVICLPVMWMFMWRGDMDKFGSHGVNLDTSWSNINSGIAMVLIQTTHLFGFKPLVWNHTSAWWGDMAKINIPLNNQKKCWEVAQYFFVSMLVIINRIRPKKSWFIHSKKSF